MKRIVLTALALGVVAAYAAPTYRAHMTGAQYVRDMLAVPDGGLNSFQRQRAMGYMDGVMDAAQGSRWCPAGRAVPHELNYEVAEALHRLPPAQLERGAASLILDVLGKLYPCGGSKP